jgi:hypothetical protein
MDNYNCTKHNQDFDSLANMVEHVRRYHASFIIRHGRLGSLDTHGHMWYCFACDRPFSHHRSYDTHKALWDHLKASHETEVETMVHDS